MSGDYIFLYQIADYSLNQIFDRAAGTVVEIIKSFTDGDKHYKTSTC